MKTQPFLIALLLGFSPLSLKAQNTNAPAQGAPPQPPIPRGEHAPMAKLSDEERAQVKAAHDKAIQHDPSLDEKMVTAHRAMMEAMKAAHLAMEEAMKPAHLATEEAEKSMHDAMIAADPSVEPILSKMRGCPRER